MSSPNARALGTPYFAQATRWMALAVSLLLCAAMATSCAGAPPPPPPCPGDGPAQAIAGGDLMGLPAGQTAPSDAVPVGVDDPQRGSASALVTVVEFGDYQCPFCARVNPTIERLLEVYGTDQVRFVWKHLPLSFHEHARPAAEMAVAVMKLDGNDAFWRFHRRAFESDGRLDPATLGELARSTGHDMKTLAQAIAEHGRAKVDADEDLAGRLGVRGTPGFLINGIFLSGAQPFEKFAAIVDQELAAAKLDLADGTPRERLYAKRVADNRARAPGPAREDDERDEKDDRTVWAVPVDGSPVLGKADAPVTIVQFTDYQCPFCTRANATVLEVRRHYGEQVRLVHKHRPLPFHPQARPASRLTLAILAKKGNDAFWQASDALFAGQERMRPDTQAGQDAKIQSPGSIPIFRDLAAQYGIPQAQAVAAMESTRNDARIAQDEGLADDLEAGGTPTFFINGRRLVGAQPAEAFKAMIDEELVKARALVASGIRPDKVYEAILATARKAELQLETVDLPAPTAANPSRGPANAPVVVQVFSDFQCPFCRRLVPVLDELATAYPKDVRIVFRHLPLPMHPDAQPAAEASMEAFAQGGRPAFWKMHDALFAADSQGALQRQGLEQIAKTAGVDVPRLQRALDSRKHQAVVEADAKLAESRKIHGTPTVVIGRYMVSGAQPAAKFKRAVERALADRKQAKPAQIAQPAQPAKR